MEWRGAEETWPLANHSEFVLSKPHKWHMQRYGKGPCLLLLHGAGGATHSWRELGSILAENYTIIAIDLPGQGFTKLGAQRRCGLAEMAEDIAALLKQEKIEPAAVIGHSAGAAIALQMHKTLGDSTPIVGINAALGNFKGLAGFLFPMIAKGLAAMPLVANLFTASSSNPKSVKRLIEGTGSMISDEGLMHYQRLVSSPTHVNATLSMMAQWDLDPLIANLPTITAPSLLLASSADKAVPASTSSSAAGAMPNCRFEDLGPYGHLVHEEQPDLVAERINAFLAEDR